MTSLSDSESLTTLPNESLIVLPSESLITLPSESLIVLPSESLTIGWFGRAIIDRQIIGLPNS